LIQCQTLLNDSHTCLLMVVVRIQWYTKAIFVVDDFPYSFYLTANQCIDTLRRNYSYIMLYVYHWCFKICIATDVIAKMQIINAMSFGFVSISTRNIHVLINLKYYVVCFHKYNIWYFISTVSLLSAYSHGSF